MPEKRTSQLPFNAVLFEREGRFYFLDPTSSLVASGSTVAQAYDKFAEVRANQLGDLDRAGLNLPGPAGRSDGAAARPGFGREIALFTTKFCIALVIVAAIGLPIAAGIARGVGAALSAAAASIQPISLSDIVQKAADVARDAEQLPPEKKESLRRSIAVIKRELGPVVDALGDSPAPQPASNR